MKYHRGLIIGRFQPFHKGHLYLLQKSLELCDQIIIAVGSANVINEANPLSYELRKQLIQKVSVAEDFDAKVLKIVPSFDFPTDQKWFEELKKNTGEFEVGIGNNEWTNGVLQQAGYPAIEIDLLDRKNFQGTYIRQLIRTEQSWQHLVPKSIIDEITQAFSSTFT